MNEQYILHTSQGPKKMWLSTVSASDKDWFSEELREKNDAAVERLKHNDCYDTFRYCMNDALVTQEFYKHMRNINILRIKNVIFNKPATIVFWNDGTKTVVKCQAGDTYDPEKGLAMAVCKKALGYNDSQSNFNDIFKEWLPKVEEKKKIESLGKVVDINIDKRGIIITAKLNDLPGTKKFIEQHRR